MKVIEEFITRYQREYDYYSEVSRIVAQQLDAQLQATGIRAIVTFRAKRPDRLETKLKQRIHAKGYKTVDDIYDDIVDLAGVRVALYFPGDRDKVGKIIQEQFALAAPPKEFPTASTPTYKKRFSGYWATHYRVQLLENSLSEDQKRYAIARTEIQVASVLMHAWAEVEHDLVYKPLQGSLSEDEYAILDELNGMVLAGEIALERLQKAVETRVAKADTPFSNHYELAAFLFEAAKPLLKAGSIEPPIGRVDVLFDLLQLIGIDTPEKLKPYIESLDPDLERRPIAEQIIDQILAADSSRYSAYEQVRLHRTKQSVYKTQEETDRTQEEQKLIGNFMAVWIAFERVLRELRINYGKGTVILGSPSALLRRKGGLDKDTLNEIERVRRLRNDLVHGIKVSDIKEIEEATKVIENVLQRLTSSTDDEIRDAIQRALSTDNT